MKIVSYLHFNGHCEAAFTFYKQVLGGKLADMRNHGDSPMAAQTPKEWHPKILHAQLEIGDQTLMGSDAPPDWYKKPAGYMVALLLEDEFEAERVFHALAEGGQVTMPIAPTFWAPLFGMLTDRFGIPWSVSGGSVP
jgi:PhnB protein